MAAPKTDRAGIVQTIRALRKAGWEIEDVWDGEESIPVSTETAAVAAIMAVDQATLNVKRGDGDIPSIITRGWVFFVMGNDPDEVICDYTVNLDPAIDDLQRGWWS